MSGGELDSGETTSGPAGTTCDAGSGGARPPAGAAAGDPAQASAASASFESAQGGSTSEFAPGESAPEPAPGADSSVPAQGHRGGTATAADDTSPPDGAARRRGRRWAWRAGVVVLVLAVAVTLFSTGYNAATAGRARPPAGLTYVRTGDLLTRYRVWGTGGSPVVLVHGAAESADTWERLTATLARDHRVYALDLDGAGYTVRRGPFTVDHQARQLLAFLSALRVERPVLVAHSAGAAVAAEAVLRAPAAAGGLMFLDGDALKGGAGPGPAVRYLLIPPYRTTMLRMGLRSEALIRSIYSAQCGSACPRLDAAGVDTWRRPYEVAGAEAGVWASLRAGVPGLAPERLARLRTVRLPKAVVYGADDHVFGRTSAANTARRIGAPPPTLIPGARHLTMISSPQVVAAEVERLAGRRAP